MPCYQIITSRVVFKVENIDLLKKAVQKQNIAISTDYRGVVRFQKERIAVFYDPKTDQMSSTDLKEKELIGFANSVKRAYSETVLDEIAKKNKWLKKKMGENQYQLQRF